jgi:hypothetical protein
MPKNSFLLESNKEVEYSPRQLSEPNNKHTIPMATNQKKQTREAMHVNPGAKHVRAT